MSEILYIVLLSSGIGATIGFLFKHWAKEKIKHSISHEYSEKLESFKNELNTKIQNVQHENQINQLRTSLFFDHQRDAFAGILTNISEVNKEWYKKLDFEEGDIEQVPPHLYNDLEALINKHQLFLDHECLMAVNLLLEAYNKSFPIYDGSSNPPTQGDISTSLHYVQYIQYRLSSVFRQKIGVVDKSNAVKELALLGSINLLNDFHFKDIGLPPAGELRIKPDELPANAVSNAEKHIEEIKTKLKEFDEYLSKGGGVFHEPQLRLRRYISILS